ncbi:protein O-glucosyltransferase 2-like isoform X2 [Lycorma delicatula]|uniref:protein O-glucosyltransferase 2-like isoform X2 n=1 Tax=Lycorma delicatula TaxID=130591 RepID=UPI003F516E13
MYVVFVFILFYFVEGFVDFKSIKVYGPGISPAEIVMPARYFFVSFKDALQKKYIPLVKDELKVSVEGKYMDNRECRLWVNILDRKDGVFIVRYKLYEPCSNFKINVKFKGVHVGDSPYDVDGVVTPEECYCPEKDFKKWLNTYQCLSKDYKQINEDLKPFPSVNFTSFRKEALKKFDQPGSMSVCNYVVVKNKIYRKCYGEHVGFKMFMDAILLSLTRKTVLPDIELLVNLGDWPLMNKNSQNVFPLFSWCGSVNTFDIVMPTYDITLSSLECMGRVSLDMLSVQGNLEKSWLEKEEKAFWRGRDSSRERLTLIEIARQNPNLFNASLTNFFFFRDMENTYGPKEKHISFFKFFDDLSNLLELIKWAMQHDNEAKVISENGQNFAEANLLPQHIFCYYAVLLYEWSKRLESKVKVRKNMEYVPQPEQNDCTCDKKINQKILNEKRNIDEL